MSFVLSLSPLLHRRFVSASCVRPSWNKGSSITCSNHRRFLAAGRDSNGLQENGRRAVGASLHVSLLQRNVRTHEQSSDAAWDVASHDMGGKKDAGRDCWLALEDLHKQLTQALQTPSNAPIRGHQEQQMLLLRPGSPGTASTAPLVAAGLILARNLLVLLQQHQAVPFSRKADESMHANDSSTTSSDNSSSNDCGLRAHSVERQRVRGIFDTLMVVLREAGCPGGEATALPATAAAAESTTTDAVYVQSARVAVLLLQCLLLAERQRRLEMPMVLAHIQTAAHCLAAAAAAQLQVQHQIQQRHQERPPSVWYLHQRIELAVLLKRSVRLLAALLRRCTDSLHQRQQQQQTDGCSPALVASANPFPRVAGPPSCVAAATAAFLSVQKLVQAAARLAQFSPRSQQQEHSQQVRRRNPDGPRRCTSPGQPCGVARDLPHAASSDSAGVATAAAAAAVAAANEMRHLPPLLLWLLPSLCNAVQSVGSTTSYALWAAAARLAERQQQWEHIKQLQLPELSLLLISASRLSSLQLLLDEQQQQQSPVAASGPSAGFAACRQQVLHLAACCSWRAAGILSADRDIEREQQPAASVAVAGAAFKIESVSQQQEHQQPSPKHHQLQRPWIRQSCIMLLGLTRLLQQEDVSLAGVVDHPRVQQALLYESLDVSSGCRSRRWQEGTSNATLALGAAAIAFMTALEKRLIAAEWIPVVQRSQRLSQQQMLGLQGESQQPQQRLRADAAAGAAALHHAAERRAPGRLPTDPGASSGAAAGGRGHHMFMRERVFLSGRDFVHLVRSFVSARFLSSSFIEKSLAFIAACPPVVTTKRRQQGEGTAISAAGNALEMCFSPQDAALLLWALGNLAAFGISGQGHRHYKGSIRSFSTDELPVWRRLIASERLDLAAAVPLRPSLTVHEQHRLSPQVQLAVRRHMRRLATELLLGTDLEGPGALEGPDAASGGTLADPESSCSSSNNSCRADTQAIANALWGLACCGLLQRRLLRAVSLSSSFRSGFLRCSSNVEKRQLQRAALLLQLQRSRAPSATVAADARGAQRGPRRLRGACAGAARQWDSSNEGTFLTVLDPQQPHQEQKKRQRGSKRRPCNGEDACEVRPSLLQQQVLHEVQLLLQQPVPAGSATSGATSAAALASPMNVVHECTVWPGLHVDIALVLRRQHREERDKHHKKGTAAGRVRMGIKALRIAIEVEGPSHFLVVLSKRGGEDSGHESRQGDSPSNINDNNIPNTAINSNRNDVAVDLRPDGGTALKHRLLRLLGWRVVHVCFAEWQQLQGRPDLQQQLLMQYPEFRRLLRLQRRARGGPSPLCVSNSTGQAQRESLGQLHVAAS